MDTYEINKILGALLFTLLVLVALNITADAIFSPQPPAKPGYEIAVQEHPEKGGPKAPAEKKEPSVTVALASANIEKGHAETKKCATCHTFEKGGPNRVGPNLWGIVGREKGSHPGFAYSDGLKKMGGKWTFEDLYHFLRSPKGMIPGTKMTFIGLPKASDRADVIAYLNKLSDNPQPLPKAAEKPTEPASEKSAEKPDQVPKAAAAPQAKPAPVQSDAPAKTETPAKSDAPAASSPPAAAAPPPAAPPAEQKAQ